MAKRKLTDSEVITALMASHTITEAAELLEVSRQTVYNYLAAEGFDEKLKTAQLEREQQLANLRETATYEAVSYLVQIIKNDDFYSRACTKDKIEASKVLLSFGGTKKAK